MTEYRGMGGSPPPVAEQVEWLIQEHERLCDEAYQAGLRDGFQQGVQAECDRREALGAAVRMTGAE